jgi:hypothetical protein
LRSRLQRNPKYTLVLHLLSEQPTKGQATMKRDFIHKHKKLTIILYLISANALFSLVSLLTGLTAVTIENQAMVLTPFGWVLVSVNISVLLVLAWLTHEKR